MALEIERKFLVSVLPDLSEAKAQKIRQGYLTLPSDSVQVRLRQKADRFFLTVKGQGGMIRSEHEIELHPAKFDALWPTTDGLRLEKTRWTGALDDGTVFELDLFDDRPLRLVEVEFPSLQAAEAFVPPDWFGPEVTGDPAYSNNALAKGDTAES